LQQLVAVACWTGVVALVAEAVVSGLGNLVAIAAVEVDAATVVDFVARQRPEQLERLAPDDVAAQLRFELVEDSGVVAGPSDPVVLGYYFQPELELELERAVASPFVV